MTCALVTGGSGFLGSWLVSRLVQEGRAVRVLDNNYRTSTVESAQRYPQVEYLTGDVCDPRAVSSAMSGVDEVYHLAAINGTANFYAFPHTVLEVGVKGHLVVMEAAAQAGVTLLLYASSSEVYHDALTIPTPETAPGIIPDFLNPRYSYSGSKIAGELLTLHYLPDATYRRIIVRPHNVYGPAMGFDHVLPQIVEKIIATSGGLKRKEAHITLDGDVEDTRAFCFASDAADGILVAATRGSDRNIYNVGREDERSIGELAGLIGGTLGVRVTAHAGRRPMGSPRRRCPDIRKLQRIGFEPRVPIESGLAETVPWYRDYFVHHQNEGA